MKTLLICLGLFIIVTACQEHPLVYERQAIKGNLILKDDFAETPAVVATEATIYLSLNDKADPYLYKVNVSDKEGKFDIPFQPTKLNSDEHVYLIARSTDKTGLPYEYVSLIDSPLLHTTSGNIEIALTPLYPKYVLKVKVVDNTSNNEPVNKTDVYLFLNANQAATISDTEPKGYVQKLTTNEKGVAFFSNLASANYYIRTKTTTPAGTTPSSAMGMAVASKKDYNKITPVVIPLTYPATKNSIQLTVLRDNQTKEPLINVDVFLFTSYVQALSVNEPVVSGVSSVSGNIGHATTNTQGLAAFQGLADGKYYVAFQGVLPGVGPVSGISDVIPLDNTQPRPYPVTLYPLTYPTAKNSIQLTVVSDFVSNEPLANLDAYLFTSEAQAGSVNDLVVSGSIGHTTTDTKGLAIFQGLADGKYYVGFKGTVSGNRPVSNYSSVINLTTNQSQSVKLKP